jgi:hypothetical protein
VVNVLRYPLDRILLMYVLGCWEGLIVHAAGLNFQGKGFLFPGKSGAGKTTLSHLFTAREGFEVLSDDRMAVRKTGGAFKCYGTPWPGEARIAVNKGLPLAGIFFLHKSQENMIRKISLPQALARLFPVVSIPWYEKEMVPGFLDFCEDLVSGVPVYDLHFRPDEDCMKYFQEFISSSKLHPQHRRSS